MKNILSVMAAVLSVGGVANAQVATVTVDTDPATANVLNSAKVGVSMGRDSERTEGVVVWDLEGVRARFLGVPVGVVGGLTFGRALEQNVGVFGGVGVRVLRVMGTDVTAGVGYAMPVNGPGKFVLEGEPRWTLTLSRPVGK
jgi:hypothetical protein